MVALTHSAEQVPVASTSFETVAHFRREFAVPGLGEALPAGEYAVKVELKAPPGCADPGSWKASVLVQLRQGQALGPTARRLRS